MLRMKFLSPIVQMLHILYRHTNRHTDTHRQTRLNLSPVPHTWMITNQKKHRIFVKIALSERKQKGITFYMRHLRLLKETKWLKSL